MEKAMKNLWKNLGILLLVAAVSAATTLTVVHYTNPYQPTLAAIGHDSVAAPAAYSRFASLPQAGETDFTNAAELSVNAVVHVKTTYRSQASQQRVDPFFEFFFGRPGQTYETPAQQASGSGVIISEDGYIVTNNHVIDHAEQIQVVLNDKREYTATLVGTDPTTDIALLKIDETGLPVILMGNSDALRVGEWVLAVGNPFNLTSTVTAGIVSAKARNINILNADMKIESFIQTDAAVNPFVFRLQLCRAYQHRAESSQRYTPVRHCTTRHPRRTDARDNIRVAEREETDHPARRIRGDGRRRRCCRESRHQGR